MSKLRYGFGASPQLRGLELLSNVCFVVKIYAIVEVLVENLFVRGPATNRLLHSNNHEQSSLKYPYDHRISLCLFFLFEREVFHKT